MRSKYLKALLPVLSIAGYAHAHDVDDEGLPVPVVRVRRIPRAIHYRNRMMVFIPWHQCYERIEINALYGAAEIYALPVAAWPNKHHHHRHNVLVNAEVRFGYNYFFNGRDHITPFAGIGFVEHNFRYHHHDSRHHLPGVAYGTLGFRYYHDFNSVFSLGCNGKHMFGGPVKQKHHGWGSPVIGLDLSMTATFRFGYWRHWDIRLEPFYMVLYGSGETQNFLGGRSNVGYRF